MKRTTMARLGLLCGMLAGAGGQALPAHADEAPKATHALRGLDPVELCGGHEVAGDPARVATHGGHAYAFASEANRAAFTADPERYAIQWGGACARMGPVSGKGAPDRFLVHEGRIYVFASEDCRATFAKSPASFFDPDEPAPTGSDAHAAAGRAWIEKAVEATGGAQALDAVRTYVARFDQPGSAPGLALTTEWSARFPDDLRRHRHSGGRWPETAVVTASDGFLRSGDSVETMHPAARRELRRAFARTPFALLRARTREDFRAYRRGDRDLAGTAVVEVEVGTQGVSALLRIERGTGRLHSFVARGRGRGGAFTSIDDTLSDERAVGALRLAHHRDPRAAGVSLVTGGLTFASIVVDEPLADDLFRR